ncbi:MAG TPA: hypothetical protein VE669_10000 [Actinomycetota bacterium]|nr:hypothetical protein [Actinomycetota bacterium]
MSRYGALVEREMARMGPAPFTLVDLQRLGERKRRTQRVAAGLVALLVMGMVAGGLGWILGRGAGGEGDLRPAAPQARPFTGGDLDAIVLSPEDVPLDTPYKWTRTGQAAVAGPVEDSSDLTVSDLAGSGTGFVDARTAEFLEGLEGLPDSRWFGSVALLYEDRTSADRVLRLLVEDFGGRDRAASRRDVPTLGPDAVRLRGAVIGTQGGPAIVYLWRTDNLVLIAAGAPGIAEDLKGIPEEVGSIAEQMNARAIAPRIA